jgi:hypothetical protein
VLSQDRRLQQRRERRIALYKPVSVVVLTPRCRSSCRAIRPMASTSNASTSTCRSSGARSNRRLPGPRGSLAPEAVGVATGQSGKKVNGH